MTTSTLFPEIDPAAWNEPGCSLGPARTTIDPNHDLVDGQVPEEIGADETDENGEGLREALPEDAPEPDTSEPEGASEARELLASGGSVPPLEGPHIQAAGYRSDRSRDGGRGVIYVIIHSAEGAKDEIELGRFFAGSTAGSSNAGIGQDGGYATYVDYSNTAWANPPINDNSDSLEICGFAAWSRATWLAHPKMLDSVAHWIAWRCQERGVPITRLLGGALRNGHGMSDHKAINDVYKASWHWDVGPGFPFDVVLKQARRLANQAPLGPDRPVQYPRRPRVQVKVVKGDTLSKIGARYRCPVAAVKTENGLANDVIRIGQVLRVPDLRPTVDGQHLIAISTAWKQHHRTGQGGGVNIVSAALDAEGVMPAHDNPGVWGPRDETAYAAWQHKLGYRGADADGVVGMASLRELGRRHAFKVR